MANITTYLTEYWKSDIHPPLQEWMALYFKNKERRNIYVIIKHKNNMLKMK
jgi:hypothetical protein